MEPKNVGEELWGTASHFQTCVDAARAEGEPNRR